MNAKKDELFSLTSNYFVKELFKSEKHFQKLIENIHEVIFMCDDEGRLNFLNQSWGLFLGYSIEESLGRPITDFVQEEDRSRILTLISEEKKHCELRFCHSNRNIVWLELSVCKGYSEKNIGVLYNINRRKLLEEKINVEREKLFAVLNGLPAFVYLRTDDYFITFCNDYFKELFGDGIGKLCYEIIHHNKKPCETCYASDVFKTKVPKIWEWANHKEGKAYQIYDYPFIDIDGTQLVLKLGIDITYRKNTETEREKMIKTIETLENSLSMTNTLSGLIPICASCKKIRDDKGDWNHIEQYIKERTKADFTHGICPDCRDDLYPELRGLND